MKKLLTIEEFMEEHYPNMHWDTAAAKAVAKDFARHHLDAQKEAIIYALNRKGVLNISSENLIRNTYPSENVK